ncbi:MAG: nuclear transport factor 2 family protein, partial [Acidimicrobiales bacterium]
MTDSDVASVVRSYLGSFAGRDPAAIAAHVSDDFRNEHVSALGRGCVGRDEYELRLPTFLDGMQGLEYTVEDLLVDGDRAVVTYTMTALWQGAKPVEVRGAQR